jgi:acetyl esterase/lipase
MPNSIPLKFRIGFAFAKLMMLTISPKRGNKSLPKMNARVKYADGVKHERTRIGGVACDVIAPADGARERTVLYIHGGGFVYGQSPIHLKYCGLLAKRLRARIVAVDYSLEPFPAGLDDCFAVYKAVVDEGAKPEKLALVGDSAGGCYTLTLLLKIKEQNLPLPCAAVAISPCVSGCDDGFDPDFTDPLLPHRACRMFTVHYRGNENPTNPLMSPIFGDFAEMPPILIFSGEHETLLKSVETLASRAKQEGWNITLKVVPGMFHTFPLAVSIPEGKQATEEIIAFLMSLLAEKGELLSSL